MDQSEREQNVLAPSGSYHKGMALILVIFIMSALMALAAMISAEHARGQSDQDEYHYLAIARFAKTWPVIDIANYESMTTPGYHWVLAGIQSLTGASVNGLRGVNAAFTLIWVGALAIMLRQNVRTTLALCLPVCCSVYVVSSGVWLLPDNLAWALVLGCIGLSLSVPASLATMVACQSAVLLLLVLVRQNQIWVGLPMLIGSATTGSKPGRRLIWTCVAMIPAGLALGYFLWTWRGLTPPMFHDLARQGNPSVPAFILCIFGVYGVWFLGYVLPTWRAISSRRGWMLIGAGAGAAIVIASIFPTSLNEPAGRYTGLWMLSNIAPVLADRSLAIIACAGVGGAVLTLLLAGLSRRDRYVFAALLIAFTLTQSRSFLVWQRYYEPMILMLLPLMCARQIKIDARPRWAWVGPVILAGGLFGIMLKGIGAI